MNFVLYVCDTETTGLDPIDHDVIELSLYRMSDDSQKTWCFKPFRYDTIDLLALRINGHKMEDLKHETKFGRETYLDPVNSIVEIENWIMEDDVPAEQRVLIAHNVAFDKTMIGQLWKKCNSNETFPFGRRSIDTMSLEFFMDYAKGSMAEGYSLNNLAKKYGIVNAKAHSAEADTKTCKEVFLKQVELIKKLFNKEK